MMRKREEKERETEMEREKEKEREMERQLGDGKKKDGENLREEQGHCWTRKAVIAAVWYLSTINIFLLLVFGRFFPLHPQRMVYDYVMKGSILEKDPFSTILMDIDPLPNVKEFGIGVFLIATAFGGPVLFLLYAYIMSVMTHEWEKFPSFQREAKITAKALFITSPLLAYILHGLFSCNFGKLYYDIDTNPLSFIYTFIISPFLFYVISDATFYWGHRLWHNPFLYKHSHYYHHSCRPTTSFAGNAADIFEIVFTGYLAAILPPFLVPIHGRVFLIVTAISHVWTIFLHNNKAIRVGFGIYDSRDHNIHHYYGQKNYNFGLYFQFWDRLMGTYKESISGSARLAGEKVQ